MSKTALHGTALHESVHENNYSDDSALIEATALNRTYGDYQALHDFNLTLRKGEVLGLLGSNGAGKSTTMQILTGNIAPSSGEISIKGINLIHEPEIAKSAIGYLPETPPIYKDMTVREYLSYCAALRGFKKSQKSSAVNESSERCGLQDVQNKLIGNLSKGFQQRVGIAQAIIHKPDVVILDEPTVGLDPLQINQIRQLIGELGKDHAVILSTHILPEVQAVCDRVQIINKGQTVFSDTLAALSSRQTSNEIIVSFSKAIDVKQLEALNTIESLVALASKAEQNRYRLTVGEQFDSASIFNLAVDKGWELIELSPQTETLEQIFMNLVHSENNNLGEMPTNDKGASNE